jgi:hypothetical protein
MNLARTSRNEADEARTNKATKTNTKSRVGQTFASEFQTWVQFLREFSNVAPFVCELHIDTVSNIFEDTPNVLNVSKIYR